MRRRDTLRLAASAAATLLAGRSAGAEESFPDRQVHIIVPFPPGSALDMTTRLVADQLAETWKQTVVVENLAGGSGNVGASRVARAEPDGYTLLSTPPGPIALNKLLYKDTNFDATKFTPVSLLATVPNVLVVRKGLPATFKELLDYARANPGKLNYAAQGTGSTGYLTARQLEIAAGIKMVYVPYRGAAQILSDIAAEHVDMFFDTATTSLPLQEGGLARVVATAGEERLASLPRTPAIAEFAPGFRSITWFGVVAPEGTPRPIADLVSGAITRALATPAIASKLISLHLTPRGGGVSETGKFFDAERAHWATLIRQIGVEPQ